MTRTKIDWADYTWNPVVGCTGACPYCYARRIATRFHRDFRPHWVQRNYERPFPRKAARIFVNSMSDVADWEPEWVRRVNAKMSEHPEHLFLFLTKRPGECRILLMSQNVMLGVSVTDQCSYDRLVPQVGPNNFLSVEPMHGPIYPWGRHRWIIVGAETGNRKGKVRPALSWLREIYAYTRARGIPLFFKESLREVWTAFEVCAFPQEYPGR
jgi:protein gp37